jgi:hypothetical protein
MSSCFPPAWIMRRLGPAGLFIKMPVLILARTSQGTGGDGIQFPVQAILPGSFPPRQQGAAMAVYSVGLVVARDRSDSGRMDYRQLLLALDFLHQSPDASTGSVYDQDVHRRSSHESLSTHWLVLACFRAARTKLGKSSSTQLFLRV